MISINLLPIEFRTKEKRPQKLPVIQFGIVSAVIFALLTVVFYFDYLGSSGRLNRLEEQWKKVQPQSAALTLLQNEVDGRLRQEKDFMANFVTTQRPLTNIMMWASEFLPETAWLIEMKLQRSGEAGSLLIKGVAIPNSKRSSIEQIETYLQSLKLKMPDANLSLTTTRQKIDGAELTQFISNFQWGKKAGA